MNEIIHPDGMSDGTWPTSDPQLPVPDTSMLPGSEKAPPAAVGLLKHVVRGAHDTIDRLAESAAPAVRQLGESVEAAGVALQVRAEGLEGEVAADSDRVALVLSNLVSNALRHTPPGGRVTLAAEPAGPAVRFEVADTGEGIPREYLDRIFDRYFRVPGRRAGGVGLGLYLVRELVQAHGGKVGVESTPGQGSRFWFTLPLAASDETQADRS